MKRCPKGHGMRELQRTCKYCNWQDPELLPASAGKDVTPDYDHQCSFFHKGERCPMPGVISAATRTSQGTRWVCGWHFETRNDVAKAINVFYKIKNGEIKIDHITSEEVLALKMEQLKSKQPLLFYKPQNEQEQKELQEICMAYMKKVLQAGSKLPYDKNEQLAESGDHEHAF